MGLPTSKHVILFKPAGANGEKAVGRKYTPVSPINQKGTIDFVIKCYPQCEEFPNGGVMGRYLETLNVGDKILMEGPVGRLTYMGNCMIHPTGKTPLRITKLGLIAGGSGITPLFSIMDAIYRARENCIDVKMLYSNKTLDDILLRSELDTINSDASAPNISVTHTLTREQRDLAAPLIKGRVSIEMLQQLGFPEPSPETLYILCGPRPFNQACKEMLISAGHAAGNVFG